MKKQLKTLSVLIMATLMFAVGCSKDDSPTESDLFVGTYTGDITFTGDGETMTDDDGKVTVSKVGSTYNFTFGSGIPDINGVKFEESNDGTYVSIGDCLTGISISASSLNMLVTNSEGTWTADCSR